MCAFCTLSISIAPTVALKKKRVITGLLWDAITECDLGFSCLHTHSHWLWSHGLHFVLEAAIVLFVIKITLNFLHGAGAGKRFWIVPCICEIVWDCDAVFSSFSRMGFINNHNACHLSWGNIYRFPWILCPSCIHLNTSRHKHFLSPEWMAFIEQILSTSKLHHVRFV